MDTGQRMHKEKIHKQGADTQKGGIERCGKYNKEKETLKVDHKQKNMDTWWTKNEKACEHGVDKQE